MSTPIPHCLSCKNYFITHDPARPYGCRAMSFKCKINPARYVYESSGLSCQLYIPKKAMPEQCRTKQQAKKSG